MLGLRVGYNSKRLCHHCFVESGDGFTNVPSTLNSDPRRDGASFLRDCLQPRNPRHLLENIILYVYMTHESKLDATFVHVVSINRLADSSAWVGPPHDSLVQPSYLQPRPSNLGLGRSILYHHAACTRHAPVVLIVFFSIILCYWRLISGLHYKLQT